LFPKLKKAGELAKWNHGQKGTLVPKIVRILSKGEKLIDVYFQMGDG